jgi:hypothetical protein
VCWRPNWANHMRRRTDSQPRARRNRESWGQYTTCCPKS